MRTNQRATVSDLLVRVAVARLEEVRHQVRSTGSLDCFV